MTEPAQPSRQELVERLKLAHAEYRAEVALGWDRQKLFLTLNTTLPALIAALAHQALAARIALFCAALVAVTGALVVVRSHRRYRATRVALQAIEDALGIQDLQTTGGQREARGSMRLESFRIVDLLALVFVMQALLDVLLAVIWRAA